MKLLNKITIKSRLIIFAVVTIFIFISISGLMINSVTKLSNIANMIYSHPLVVSNASTLANVQTLRMNRALVEALISDDEIDQDIVTINKFEAMVISNLDIIRDNILGQEGKKLEAETRELFINWKPIRDKELALKNEGKQVEALEMVHTSGSEHLKKLAAKFDELNIYAQGKKEGYIAEYDATQQNTVKYIIVVLIGIMIFIVVFTILVLRSVLKSLSYLKNNMSVIASTGQLQKKEIQGRDEISEMHQDFNILVDMLQKQLWLRDGQNLLQGKLSGDLELSELATKAVKFVATYTDSACGVFYYYLKEDNILRRYGSFALVEVAGLPDEVKLGEGIVGQVGLQRAPILLKNINKSDLTIQTGTTSEPPLNTYTYPIMYENEFYGVIELASHETFEKFKLDYLDASCNIIASYLLSSEQKEKITVLYEESKNVNTKLSVQGAELEAINIELEEGQRQLEIHAHELQKNNNEMLEQQARLEVQAQELEAKNNEMHNMQSVLLEKGDLLENTNKYKSEFLANMSHELRTPLNSIILLSTMLGRNKNDNLSEDDLKKTGIIASAGNELLRLINDILDLSKIESGKMEIYNESFSTEEFTKSFVDKFDAIATQKGLRFLTNDELKTIIKSDKNKLTQVLTNLLANAFKFTDQGEVELNISESGEAALPIKITVRDTGIGITHDKQALIFEEFKQVDGTISRRYGGTGLGLAIVKNLVHLLGGKIELASDETIGSTFTVYLPKEPHIHSGFEETRMLLQDHMLDDSKEIIQGDKTILVIEDDNYFCEKLKKYINLSGYKMLVASTGQSGLAKASQHIPDGIILDLGLPDMPGGEVLRKLKSQRETRGIPVHILTVENDLVSQGLKEQGAAGFTTKSPSGKEDIDEALANITRINNKKPKYLLIVEDREEERQSLLELINNGYVKARGVATATEAIQELATGRYDAVVVDLYLAEGSGWDVCRYIKDNKLHIPVVIYTAKDLDEAEARNLEKYADSIVVKTAYSQGRLMEEVALFLHKVSKEKSKPVLYEDVDKNYKGKKVLVCDDDAKNMFSLTCILEELGIQVAEAYNGQEALDKLALEPKMDLILMDIMMPIMDGIETIKRIREDEVLRNIPVIAITAKAMKGDKEIILEAGASDYISKPIDYDIMHKLITIWLSRKQ